MKNYLFGCIKKYSQPESHKYQSIYQIKIYKIIRLKKGGEIHNIY